MTSPEAAPARLDLVDLLPLVQHLMAGARALRERQRWCDRVSFLPTDSEAAAEHAAALEGFALHLDCFLAPLLDETEP